MEIFSEQFKKEHFLSKTDARVKLIVTLALLAMVLSYKGMLFPFIIAAGCFAVCLRMGVLSRIIFLRMAQPLLLAVVVLALKTFFSGEAVMFSISLPTSHFSLLTLTTHRDGLMEGLTITSRIIGGVALVIALGFSTRFTEFLAALSWLRVPKQFMEIMMFAYRYLFVFLDDGMTIYNAQKNRLGYAGIKKGLNSFGILTGSLVLRSLEQSQKTSEAMIQRGYTGDMPVLKDKPLRFGEVAFAAAFMIIAGAIWMI